MSTDPRGPSGGPKQPDGLPDRTDSSVEATLIAAARDMLADGGVKGLTMEGVSARTGIAKTTIYRRWRSKEDLALAVVVDMTRQVVNTRADGEVRTALVDYLNTAIEFLRSTPMGKVMQGLASDLATDPQLRAAFRRSVVQLRRNHLDEVVQHGIATGQLRAGIDLDVLHEMLFGPVYYRLLVTGGRLDRQLAEQIVDALLPSLVSRAFPES